MAKKTFHITIVDNNATVERTYAVEAENQEEAIRKYQEGDEAELIDEVVDEWDDDDDPEGWDIREQKP